ncbi:MAG: indolepyruvate ferredoxin oxidoreductase subunit alpha [Coriobacteriia bacterium]|nr:indolepyruvate ferredoxin oxidoreductase subunit alpha [Coriobacteriia bacterium]MBS5477952.1 indolepyruvate ferredoxin oxidoreductase subunit alpha [Coriobacteriia bacterium]
MGDQPSVINGGRVPAERRLLAGNEAIALAAIVSGVNVACGYPGTPSTEIVETIARHNPANAIHVEWSTNEKAALELAAGASYSGARVIMTCKQVGMNVASDPLMSLAYVGCVGGLVIVVADDPGPISSQTEQDSRQFAQFAHVPVLDPASPEEAYAMVGAAFELSEAHGCPVILRPTTRVDHGCASLEVPTEKALASIPRHPIAGFKKDPRFVIFPPLARRGHERMAADLPRIAEEFDASPFNVLEDHATPDCELYLGIACGGDSRGYVREALARLEALASRYDGDCQGVVAEGALPSYRLLEVGTPFPFPEGLGRRFLDGLADVLVVEELEPVIERNLLQLTGPVAADAPILSCPVSIHGRLDGTTPAAGEYGVDRVLPILADFLGVSALLEPNDAEVFAESPAELLPPRPPVLCAGCPHRASFLAVKAAVGRRNAVYAGDIGCYTLGCNHPLDATDTCLCMGGGVTVAQGLATAAHLAGDDETLHVGFVGDSTFFASAMTGIANAVYNQHRLCLVVLDNATTAMTGSQPHPGTGVTLMGTRSEPISIPEVCRALGCEVVEVADPLDFEAARAAAERALDCEHVSVVVYESPCVQLFRPLPAVSVRAGACTGCGACVRKTGCPALSMGAPVAGERRGKAHVDASLCNGCDLCVRLCAFGALETPRAGLTPEQRDQLRREAGRG